MHKLAQRVLSRVRQHEFLKAGERIGVAVSGGTDSVALLRLLLELRAELGIVLSVVHFNHQLRGAASDADERFVAELARKHSLEFICDSDDVAGFAREEGISLETAARELRYGFFRHLLRTQGLKPPSRTEADATAVAVSPHEPSSLGSDSEGAFPAIDKILTGHTLDDQAETVLMRLIRGAGFRGLGGIHPRVPVEEDNGEFCGEILRPLLTTRRKELQQYLSDVGQDWREDATNTDQSFTRNRVRKLLVPLLEKEFNPSIAENLSELAEIARGEEDYWQNEVAGWMGTGVHWVRPEWAEKAQKPPALIQIARSSAASSSSLQDLQEKIANAPWLVMNASIDLLWFLGEPIAVQRRILKAIGEEAGIPLEFRHVEEALGFAEEECATGKALSLPLGWKLIRHPGELVFVTPDLRNDAPPTDYEYPLPVPGLIDVREAGFTLEARRISTEDAAAYNPDQLLDADSVTGPLLVRNWRPGDRYWPAHTSSPKKIKELLQERHIARPERDLWTVILRGEEIIWMRDFPAPAKYGAKVGRPAIVIIETPTGSEARRRMPGVRS